MSIEQFIANEVKGNDVVLFMKGTPQFPQCGFSGQVVQILDYLGVPYKGMNVLESDDLRQGVKAYSNWPTVPQLYVKGEFVGGCDIVREMFQAGELQSLLKDKGVPVKDQRAGLTRLFLTFLIDCWRSGAVRPFRCDLFRPPARCRGTCRPRPSAGRFPWTRTAPT